MAASRIANVSVIIRTGSAAGAPVEAAALGAERDSGTGRSLVGLCRALFDQVIEIGAGGSGTDLAAALSAATGERVLVVEAEAGRAVTAEGLLALVAWPERSALRPVDADGADLPWAIFRREECLAQLQTLEIERVPLAALGLDANDGRPGGGEA